MSSIQTHGSRTNTFGGKEYVVQQMTKHYQALANMKSHVDTSSPVTRTKHQNLLCSPHKKNKHNLKSPNKPLPYKKADKPKDWLSKTKAEIKRIKNSSSSKNIQQQINLSEKFIERRLRKEKREMKEHQKRLDKISAAIYDLEHQSLHDRKRNQFDPIANPVVLFRRSPIRSPMNKLNRKKRRESDAGCASYLSPNVKFSGMIDCLSDSKQNLGKRKLYKDNLTPRILRYSIAKQLQSKSILPLFSPLPKTMNLRINSCQQNKKRFQKRERPKTCTNRNKSQNNIRQQRPMSAIHSSQSKSSSNLRRSLNFQNIRSGEENDSLHFNFSSPRKYNKGKDGLLNKCKSLSISPSNDEKINMINVSTSVQISNNNITLNDECLCLKNKFLAEILSKNIFSEENLIAFFKLKFKQYGNEDRDINIIIKYLCEQFQVTLQKVKCLRCA